MARTRNNGDTRRWVTFEGLKDIGDGIPLATQRDIAVNGTMGENNEDDLRPCSTRGGADFNQPFPNCIRKIIFVDLFPELTIDGGIKYHSLVLSPPVIADMSGDR